MPEVLRKSWSPAGLVSQLRTVQTLALIGMLAVATILGSLLLGYGLLLPGLEGAELIDANLAHALARPLYLRTGEVLLLACVVLVAVVPKWVGKGRASTVALVLTAVAALDRLVVLPGLTAAWTKVDAVAQLPAAQMEAAQRWSDYHVLLAVVMAGLVLGLIGLAIRRNTPEGA